jgi:NAD-dependent dihydropyrimidine dehydrogenase PreA subunit
MSGLNFGDCIGCGLCILGCPAYEETGFDVLTARGRNKGLQAGLAAADLKESIWACTLCGYCDAICPNDVANVDIVLHLRRELFVCDGGSSDGHEPARAAGGDADSPPRRGSSSTLNKDALVIGCTIRERAPHLVASIQEFLARIGRPATASTGGCCGALEVEAGRTSCVKVTAGVVADPVCLEQYDAEFLGVLAMQHLDLFDLEPPFYYYAPHRLINREHARVYPLYDRLRTEFGCDMNLDLNRLARSTSAGSLQGLSGRDARDIPAAVARLLAHSRAERIVTCSPADYLAFKAYSGRETRYITECLR